MRSDFGPEFPRTALRASPSRSIEGTHQSSAMYILAHKHDPFRPLDYQYSA